jgi:hypothetical protein
MLRGRTLSADVAGAIRGGSEIAVVVFWAWSGGFGGRRTGEVLEVAAAAATPAQAPGFLQGLKTAQGAIDMYSSVLDRFAAWSQRFFVGHLKENSSC